MDLSWVSLKLDSEMSTSLLPLWESVSRSQGLRALRQCWEGVGLSTERWYGVDGDGGISIPGSKPGSEKGMEWDVCGNCVKTWQTITIYLICYCIGNPSFIGSFDYVPLASNFHKAMLIGMGVASTNRTDKFWHTSSAKEYSSKEIDGWGVRAYARVWRFYLQAVLNECYFWFRRCSDVINYVILHYLYSDIIIVWMWYSIEIWVIWSTTVIINFDSVDFPSRKSGRFT